MGISHVVANLKGRVFAIGEVGTLEPKWEIEIQELE
jgi:hypothetical protein